MGTTYYFEKIITMFKLLLEILNITVIYDDEKKALIANYGSELTHDQIQIVLKLIMELSECYEYMDHRIEKLEDEIYRLENPDYYDDDYDYYDDYSDNSEEYDYSEECDYCE